MLEFFLSVKYPVSSAGKADIGQLAGNSDSLLTQPDDSSFIKQSWKVWNEEAMDVNE